MNKDQKIKELELEVARLNGVIEGMQKDPYRLYPRPYPMPYPVPYQNPFWYQTYCGNNQMFGVTTPAIVTNTTVGTSSWQ